MNDKDFCVEYVKRLPTPLKKGTYIHMHKIVVRKMHIDIKIMYHNIDELINDGIVDYVQGYVYSFIRDNQELFLKD